MAERLEWADNNHELISRVATDPLRHLCDWEKVDELYGNSLLLVRSSPCNDCL